MGGGWGGGGVRRGGETFGMWQLSGAALMEFVQLPATRYLWIFSGMHEFLFRVLSL